MFRCLGVTELGVGRGVSNIGVQVFGGIEPGVQGGAVTRWLILC